MLLNGFLVAAEFAIVKLRLTQAEHLAEVGGLRGGVLRTVRTHLDAYLSACQLGITLASLGLGWIASRPSRSCSNRFWPSLGSRIRTSGMESPSQWVEIARGSHGVRRPQRNCADSSISGSPSSAEAFGGWARRSVLRIRTSVLKRSIAGQLQEIGHGDSVARIVRCYAGEQFRKRLMVQCCRVGRITPPHTFL